MDEFGKPLRFKPVDAIRQGWVTFKGDSKKTWKTAPKLKRYLDSRGFTVLLYEVAPAKKKNASAKVVIDLRECTALKPAKNADGTAPDSAVDLEVAGKHYTIDFGYGGERNAWMLIWCNAVPSAAVAEPYRSDEDIMSEEMHHQVVKVGQTQQVSRRSIFGGVAFADAHGTKELDVPEGIMERTQSIELNTEAKGELRVTVKGASGLKAADRSGFSDPYCKVMLGESKEIEATAQKTKTMKKTLEPTWDETFRFPGTLKALANEQLLLKVYDWDQIGKVPATAARPRCAAPARARPCPRHPRPLRLHRRPPPHRRTTSSARRRSTCARCSPTSTLSTPSL